MEDGSLKDWRKSQGLRLDDVAQMLGVTAAMWSRWENGSRRVPPPRVADVAKITGIPREAIRPDIFEAAQ